MSPALLLLAACAALPAAHAATCPPPPPPAPAPPKGSRPNIVLFLTDDQDLVLGGWQPMNKTTRLLAKSGATAQNWMVHTPVCCPSRAELMTGRYFHNIKVPQFSDTSCMYVDNSPNGPFGSWFFAPHFRNAGYQVGLFGKYLNSEVPLCPPPGIDVGGNWLANDGGNYINPSFNVDGQVVTYNETYGAYSTAVIGNVSTAWIKRVAQGSRPFFAYIAPKAPHIQDGNGWPITIPAPWYAQAYPSAKAPRLPNYNYTALDHHPLIANQPPLTDEQVQHSDELYRARWQSLMSVDDVVEAVVQAVDDAGLLDTTYFIFTSDHGYQFGQFQMPMGKWNVYENDLRIPFVIRGPGVQPNSTFDWLASNVDVMPTLLSLAGIPTPPTMDGRSLASLIVNVSDSAVLPATRELLAATTESQGPSWRTELLIEYLGLGEVVRYEHPVDAYNNTYRALRVLNSTHNLLIAEFTDDRTNYDFNTTGYFYELYDINADPYQLHNIFNATSPAQRDPLLQRLRSLFACKGASCN